jgi:biopolymer transport protein ExbD
MTIRRRTPHRSVVSLASMADIAFLLLIFFVLTSSIERREAEGVRLPRADAVGIQPQGRGFLLAIDERGRVLHEGRVLGPAGLETLVTRRKAAGLPLAPVELSGDRGVPYAVLAPYLSVLKRQGVTEVVFIATVDREGR